MGKMRWYKRDPHAALNGMMVLTLEERGAYNTILDLIYSHDGKLEDDEQFIAGWLRSDVRVWRRIKTRLITLGKLTCEGTYILNPRASRELSIALPAIEALEKLGGKYGGQNKKNNDLEKLPTQKTERTPRSKILDITERERTVSTDTESLSDKSLPLTRAKIKKINGFGNGINGNGMTQDQANDYAVQKAVEFLPGADDGVRWQIAMAAEDSNAPDHHKAVTAMLKAAKAAGVGWVSPERRATNGKQHA